MYDGDIASVGFPALVISGSALPMTGDSFIAVALLIFWGLAALCLFVWGGFRLLGKRHRYTPVPYEESEIDRDSSL